MDERAKGLLLRVHPLSETSLIVRWITLEHGKISAVAKGARRPKSPFTGKLDLFFLCEFLFTRSRKSDLHNLREVALVESWPELRRDLSVLRRASYAAALIEQTTESDSPVPELFELMLGFLEYLRVPTRELRNHEKNAGAQSKVASRSAASSLESLPVLSFEVKLLQLLGLDPVGQEAKLSPGAKQLLKHLGGADWQTLSRLRLSRGQFAELSQFLYGFMVFHLGKVPRGRRVLSLVEHFPSL